MSRESVLARGRAAAEAGMVDTCVIRRVASGSTDPDTGVITPTYATVYTGRCRVQQSAAQATGVEAGQAYRLILRLELQLPMTVTGVQPEDEVEVTASEHDPDLPGRVFRVRDLAYKSHATARRIGVEEQTS